MDSLEIPNKAGVILLPDTVLFPHGALPLHIFEPRYRRMLEEAMEGSAMFCVANLLGNDSHDPERGAAPVGTLGLIRASRESKEGTSNLLLHGVIRVYFESWHPKEKPYPYASIRPVIDTTLPASEESTYLARLRKAMNKALSGFPKEVSSQLNETLDRAGDSSTCSDAVAQQFIHDANDRQRLLETPEVRKRLDFLIQFLEKANPSV
ncbi:LON peptidase substrate-binding domain-containing protein [Verrucomicrobiaceae bacterium 227]